MLVSVYDGRTVTVMLARGIGKRRVISSRTASTVGIVGTNDPETTGTSTTSMRVFTPTEGVASTTTGAPSWRNGSTSTRTESPLRTHAAGSSTLKLCASL